MIVVTTNAQEADHEKAVDEDLAEFEKWFCSNIDTSTDKLSGPEKAIIKSYLWWKLKKG